MKYAKLIIVFWAVFILLTVWIGMMFINMVFFKDVNYFVPSGQDFIGYEGP